MSPELSDEQLIEQEKDLQWEQQRAALINQTQSQTYGALRSIQVTLMIGVSNGDFSTTFRNDVRRLLIQMAAGIEVQDVSGS